MTRLKSFQTFVLYSLFATFVLLFLSTISKANEEILGCGGFVTTSLTLPKNQKIDYSSIRMKLLTLDGVVQDSTECAPNGYYFLPIYGKDKRDFVIKVEGPAGWNFEPFENRVQINDKSECVSSQQKGSDINFQLSGFSIFGKVVGKNCGQTEGRQEGVAIELLSSSSSVAPVVLAQTHTNSQGSFTFSNVKPGNYLLKASHADWFIEQNQQEVSVESGNLKLETPFVVTGYDLSGVVVSNKEEPVLGVDFLLFSDTIKTVNCDPVATKFDIADSRKPLCAAKSDKEGKFHFKNIPCGDYQLKPFYQGSEIKTTFDVQPAEYSLTVSPGSFKVPQPFRIMGFSMRGRVVSSNGNGVAGCVIKVNGAEKTKTDVDGYYKLDQMTSSTYTIKAFKEHYVFQSLSNFKVSPSEGTTLPNIAAQLYDLCGSIQITQPPPGITVARERTVLLKQGKEIHRKTTDLSGKFCFQVASGVYELTPEIDAREKTAGLVFTNLVLTISVQDAPVLDANFIQSKVIVSGRVKCLEYPCDPSVSVSLYSENSPTRITSGLGLSGVGKGENQNDYFIFRDVPSGSYKVAVNKDSWCWSEGVIDLNVKTDDVVLEFTQTGYAVNIKLSHEANVSFASDKEGQSQEFQVRKGNHQVCLKNSGAYTVSTKSCYKFEKETYTYSTLNPQVLELTATHFRVNGNIEIPADKSSSSNDMTVSIKNENTLTTEVVPVSVVSPTLLNYGFWAQMGDKSLIKPTSSQLLFYPISRSIEITNFAECPAPIDLFQARPGLFLNGKIEPAVEGVSVKVYLEDSEEPFRQVKSNQKGDFSIGPLYDDKNYRLTAEKDGFAFVKEENSTNFQAMKLGQITVLTQDKDSNAIGGVLLSLSGEGFRSNNVAPSSGKFQFLNLSPGQYFLRPYLKEYTFQPLSYTISVKEGEDVEIQVNATRYAYSVFGNVISLNGDPEKLLIVEAVEQSSGDHYEGESDIEGNYRIRGLLPQHTYQIRVKQEPRIERATPKFETLTITNQDTYNVSFIVFRKTHKLDLSGTITTKPELLQSLKVSLFKKEDNQIVNSYQLSPSHFFEFSGLAKGEYLVKVESSLSSLVYAFSNLEQTVTLEENQVVHFTFSATPHMEAQELSNAPLLSTILFVLLFVAVFNYKKVIRYVEEARDGNLFKKQTAEEVDDWIPSSSKSKKEKRK